MGWTCRLIKQRSHVPKFGNWESEENVEYSAYFEEATKSKAKGGKMIDPNGPRDKPDRFSNYPAQVQASAFKTELEGKAPKGPEKVKSKHVQRTNSEGSDLRRLNGQLRGRLRPYGKAESEAPKDPEGLLSPIKKEACMSKQKQQFSQEGDVPRRSVDSALHRETLGGRRVTSDSPLHHQGGVVVGNSPLKTLRHSAVTERSIENSPLHPHYQARVGGKGSGVSSPSWERKGSSQHSNQAFAPLSPGISRLKPNTRGNETPDHSSAVPKFGDWDESNPASGEGYTRIFNKVLEERQNEAGRGPVLTNETSQFNGQIQYGNENTKIYRVRGKCMRIYNGNTEHVMLASIFVKESAKF
ncbi:hypothetical protein FNV43_RR01270 [Rhamnella rubrinervis]|uniref:RIN4 pathogenic type III effector avirulence factor Avr cleavage site domain-containing protein n=1 Tax=Rhamnella rubrinervis TaxID=2594499 RepID=A0A8K0HPB1_9ROSA|nr:hypothetical protein FNV43_RR01270 [Rhamnella rubrinervis]